MIQGDQGDQGVRRGKFVRKGKKENSPSYEEVEHQAENIGGCNDRPVLGLALVDEVKSDMGHQAVDGEELHEVESVGDFTDPYEK